MSKRNVTYIKPDEPSFLKKIKEQAGYKEGPTVDTKREDFGSVEDDGEFEERNEEEPTVVVLQSGDLTAEEAATVQEQIRKEAEEAPADLNKPIVFKAPSKSKRTEEEKETKPKGSKRSSSSKEQDQKSKKIKNKALLSFNEDEEEDS